MTSTGAVSGSQRANTLEAFVLPMVVFGLEERTLPVVVVLLAKKDPKTKGRTCLHSYGSDHNPQQSETS